MTQSLISKYQKRVVLPSGEQRLFLLKVQQKTGLPWELLAAKLKVCQRTLRHWREEKYTISLKAFQTLTNIAHLKPFKNVEIKNPFWYTKKGGIIGGRKVYKKYGCIGGDKEARKRRWMAWWKKTGQFNRHKHFIAREIRKPKKCSELAEYVGILIGDGGIAERQVIISLNPKTDKEYINFVQRLGKKLFGVTPSIYARANESVVGIVISRTCLVKFCQSLGLKVGNKLKQNLDFPKWIKKNFVFGKACLRGLMDTDGCIFNECHTMNGKEYCYPRLSLVSHSKQLRISVSNLLGALGFSPKICSNRCVQLADKNEIIRYFQIIGTHNKKHTKRFESFFGRVG